MPWTPDELATRIEEYRTELTKELEHNRIEADDGHTRLRRDFRAMHSETATSLELLRDSITNLRSRVELMEKTPPEVTKLRFPMSVVVAIILATASIVGTGYGFSSAVTNKIDAYAKQQDERAKERDAITQRAIDALTRRVELLQFEQAKMREDLTKATTTKVSTR